MTVEEHLIEISTNLENMQATLKEIKAENLRVWDRLDDHSAAIAKMKGWIAGLGVACTIIGLLVKLLP